MIRILLILAVALSASAVDLKPGQDLPYVRLTVTAEAGKTATDDGWWDKDLHMLFHAKPDAFGGSYPDDRIVSIQVGNAAAVGRMPDWIRPAIVEALKAQAAEKAAAAKP